jgi:L-ascorbate metabolism protein UlaG (beta-lactamase superfamily)
VTSSARIGKRVRFLTNLAGTSAMQRIEGESVPPVLVKRDQLGVTFIGHSSFLLQIGGKNLLVDPVFAQWLVLLRRLRRPGVTIEQLPPIDAVLLSHAHMDHLNRPSLLRIVRQSRRLTGRSPVAIVPWGVGDLVRDLGFERVIPLEWWQSERIDDLEVSFTPAQHWGARYYRDTHRGFGGYVIRSSQHSVYHSGDTAYFDGFEKIGKELAPQVALLPIGAYNPESFRHVHASPEDALQAFLDLGSRWMIPMHFGTFRLSEEPTEEPVKRLHVAAKTAGVDDRIRVLGEGETRVFLTENAELTDLGG